MFVKDKPEMIGDNITYVTYKYSVNVFMAIIEFIQYAR